ncbi:Leo1-like protein-domain-containing protein [Fimicolochytrium jonesii]|uniref:Leo1-like protein-domain-containing protein n=1 Tax=Fimicolochytrium jonesii TaxID=1396493 RepID=UPI0022FE48AD|nr:Leo1-like protein-domain-containing protein [Fimicolochytrium jonesii]KAI8816338.1 Leo1-like protein-domain-containing protein [Fimicolochytrium jonesii]
METDEGRVQTEDANHDTRGDTGSAAVSSSSSQGEPAAPEKGEEEEDVDHMDLFGDMESSDEEQAPVRDRRTIAPRQSEPTRPQVISTIEVPDIPKFSHGKEEVYIAKLPHFMNVEHRPFDPDTWDEEDDAATLERAGDEAVSSVQLENTLRWRSVRDENGEESKESNARLVRWSDGSFSLVLGGEFFDATVAAGPQHQYLSAQIPDPGVFQMQNRVPQIMMFRPYGVNQLVHKKLTKEIAKKHQKGIKTKSIVTMVDPEKEREALEKAEIEKVRARRRLEAKRRNASFGGRSLTSRDLEADSDDDELYTRGNTGIRQALEKYEDDFVVNDEDEDDGIDAAQFERSDDDDDEEEERREREQRDRILRAKRSDASSSRKRSTQDRDEDAAREEGKRVARDDDVRGDEEEEEEEGDMPGSRRLKKRRHIVSSEEDE